MAYDEQLARRIREALAGVKQLDEKPLVGGLTFMVNDKMCVGIFKNELMCRIDPAVREMALERNGCREMAFKGKTLKSVVLVGAEGFRTHRDFIYWIQLALDYNSRAKSSKTAKKNASGKKPAQKK